MKTDEVLTKSENKVAVGYVLGLIGKEIADKLGISHNTVVRHTQHIYDKTGIPRSTNALVAWYLTENYQLDLSELKRGLGAFILLGVLAVHMVATDFDSRFVRTSIRRVEARRPNRRRRREDEGETIYIEI